MVYTPEDGHPFQY